jgi:hypothetical protein
MLIPKLPIEPDFNIESIYDIDIMQLDEIGIKALFFDLDSTTMKSKSGKFSYKTLQFLKDLSTNFKIAIITNNKNYHYIKNARSQTDIPIYADARKPNTDVIKRACIDLNVDIEKTAMIGDRPLSDILAGKNAGMTTILVDSISKDEENFLVRFVRFLERLTIRK